jgi:uncharacterized protein YjbJ (UPF0337 family)
MKTRDIGPKSGTRDKLEGNAKIISGKVKEVAGIVFCSPKLQGKGRAQENTGRIQRKVGEIKKVLDR